MPSISRNSRIRDNKSSRRRLAMEGLEDRRMLAVVADLLRDIGQVSFDESLSGFQQLGSLTLFQGSSSEFGRELWVTDGTPSGTEMLMDIAPGQASSEPSLFMTFNNEAYFFANNGSSGALWKTNGTQAGTQSVVALQYTFGSITETDHIVWNGELYFAAGDGVNGTELWKTDGTTSGTMMVHDINPGAGSSSPLGFAISAGGLVFAADDGTNGIELWKTDGTTSGTSIVADIAFGTDSSKPIQLRSIGDTVLFAASGPNGHELWRTEGTLASTVEVKDIFPGPDNGITERISQLNPRILVRMGNEVFFKGDDGVNGVELWKSDGTTVGTVPLTNFVPDNASLFEVAATNGSIFFQGDDGVNGHELWSSDGTIAGTTMLGDLKPGPLGSSASNLVAFGDKVMFGAHFGAGNNWEPGASDGTAAGTFMLADLSDEPATEFTAATGINDAIYFKAATSDGLFAYRSDGTPSGTTSINTNSFLSQTNGLSPNLFDLGIAHGELYFTAEDYHHGTEVWKSDGTWAGTVLVEDIVSDFRGSSPHEFVELGQNVLFVSSDDNFDEYLTVSDGTPAGTNQFQQLDWFFGSITDPGDAFLVIDGVAYFAASNSGLGVELWRTDGTTAGTSIVKDIATGGDWSIPRNLTAVGSDLYFTADDVMNGRELWKSDGTESGTNLFHEFTVGVDPSNIQHIASSNGRVYIHVRSGDTSELWTSNGQNGDMSLLKAFSGGISGDLVAYDGGVFFSAAETMGDVEPWTSDGTTAGTAMVKDIEPGVNGSNARILDSNGTDVFFTADHPTLGNRIWKSDGTNAGTSTYEQWLPGTVEEAIPFSDGFVVEVAPQGGGATEMWYTDGTSNGTYYVRDLADAMFGSPERRYAAVGDRIYFSAWDEIHGDEIWYVQDVPSEIAGRHVFQNNSHWDGNNVSANANDDDAIVPGLIPLLPGETATHSNYVNNTTGITGLMIDLAGVRVPSNVALSDFEFDVGNSGDTVSWATGPAPRELAVRELADGTVRLTLTWDDNQLVGAWLRVTMKANSNTNLAEDEVFYVGSAPADTFDSQNNAFVSAFDFAGVRDNMTPTAAIDSPYDNDKDGDVDATDLMAVRDRQTDQSNALTMFTAPAVTPLLLATRDAVLQVWPTTADQRLPDAEIAESEQTATAEPMSAAASDLLFAEVELAERISFI